MSRIGKTPLELPQGVSMAIDGSAVVCKGPKGTLRLPLVEGVSAKLDGNKLTFLCTSESRHARAMHGTLRALAANMVEGVTKGYEKKLDIVGVGYKAVLQGKKLSLSVGFANIIEVMIPDGVTVKVPDPNRVEVSGIDKHLVGQLAANIRAARKPEPYKGKGVRYVDEIVRKKAGKAAAAGGAGAKK